MKKRITKTSEQHEREMLRREKMKEAESKRFICPECGKGDESNFKDAGAFSSKYKCIICGCEWKVMDPIFSLFLREKEEVGNE